MKKTLALSLTFALAGAFTCLTASLSPQQFDFPTCSVETEQTKTTNPTNRTIINSTKNDNDENTDENKFTTQNVREINPDNSNKTNSNNQNETNFNNTNTNNLTQNNKGSSPYGINNGNAGVLPNQTNSTTNTDSMLRTNNIDTYKNNTVTNIDGSTFDNNGTRIQNSTTNTTQNSANNNLTNTNNDNLTNNTNETTQNKTGLTKTNLSDSKITDTDYTNKNESSNQLELKSNDNLNSMRATYSNDDISKLNSSLSSLTKEMNEKMDTARENIDKLINNSIELDDEQIELLNAYSRVVHCLSIKLAENHFELMHAAGKLAIMQSETENESLLNPAYFEMNCTLKTREVCLNCMIETLDEMNKIFDNKISNEQTRSFNKLSAVNATPITKGLHLSAPTEKQIVHEAHSTPRA